MAIQALSELRLGLGHLQTGGGAVGLLERIPSWLRSKVYVTNPRMPAVKRKANMARSSS